MSSARACGRSTLEDVVEAARIAERELSAYLGESIRDVLAAVKVAPTLPAPAMLAKLNQTPFALGVDIAAIPRRRTAYAITATDPTSLPQKADNRGTLNPIREQGTRGTCVAFSSCAAFEAYIATNGGNATVLSPQCLYWECKENDGNPTSEGTHIGMAFRQLEQNGTCLEATWPYNPNPGTSEGEGPPPTAASREALEYRIPGYLELAPNSITEIQAQVSKKKCVPFSIPVYNSWYMSTQVQQTGIITMPIPGELSTNRGHAMCIVGYQNDPDPVHPDNPGGGVFVLRNSWGSTWGKDGKYGAGYGSIPYAYIATYGLEAYCVDNG